MKNMANKIINVLIVDDEQIVREGLRYIIDWNTLGFCICGEAANGEDALEMIRQYRPGLVLLDIRMSGMLGTELMEKARSEGFSMDAIWNILFDQPTGCDYKVLVYDAELLYNQ